MPSIVKFGVLAVVLVVVGSVILRSVQGSAVSTSTRCVYTCGPDIGAVEPPANAFHTSDGFSFSYPGNFKQASSVKGFIANFTSSSTGGEFLVAGGSGTPSLSSALSAAEQRVAPAFQDFTAVGSLPGARLGDQPGAGAIYSGNGTNGSGQEFPLRIVFITAEQGGHWATLTGVSGLNPNITPTGFNDGGSFDDVLTQWTWGS